jgi:serine/threonine protein kinase
VVKEFCIFKICDLLGSGPSVPSAFGFDIIAYNNSIEFAMEKCQPLTDLQEAGFQSLLVSLGNMHRFKIIHMDINPSNIMVSPSKRKPVFIDFGFSEVIAEECGLKTLTSFNGTPTFVSDEMMKLFSVQYKEGFVDLYHNDLVGFQQTRKIF